MIQSYLQVDEESCPPQVLTRSHPMILRTRQSKIATVLGTESYDPSPTPGEESQEPLVTNRPKRNK